MEGRATLAGSAATAKRDSQSHRNPQSFEDIFRDAARGYAWIKAE